MLLALDHLRAAVSNHVRPHRPDLVEALAAAVDCLAGTSPVTPAALAAAVEAASDGREAVYDSGTAVLGEIATRWQAGRDAIEQMANSKHAHVRHNAILCLHEPDQFSAGLLVRAMADKSARVRRKAVDWAGRLKLRILVPELEKAQLTEIDIKTRALIARELPLLRDGYWSEPAGSDSTVVTVATPSGRICRVVDNRELAGRGIEAVVSELLTGN